MGRFVPRLLINRELVGDFDLDPETNVRDAAFLGDCDEGAKRLAALLGWEQELEALVTRGDEDQRARKAKELAGGKPSCCGAWAACCTPHGG